MIERVRAHVIISGMVQGVCFRYETVAQAQNSGITGWVMNRFDGKVEAVFEGKKDAVERIVRWCHEGPSGAVVRDVDVELEEYTGEFKKFGIHFNG